MGMDLKLPEGKVVIFRFDRGDTGGPCDGTEVRSDAGPLQTLGATHGGANVYWDITDGGTIGKQIPAVPAVSLQDLFKNQKKLLHYYEVVDRQESDTEVVVLCKYSGREHKKPK
jgi:hypothetical protein